MRNLTWTLALTLFAASCSKGNGDQSKPAPTPIAPTPTPAVAPIATGSAGNPLVAPPMNVAPFANQLAYEAAHRPSNGLPVEKVFDALSSAGFTFSQREQVLGIKAKAAYCINALTPSLMVAACEYATPGDANAAVAMMEKYTYSDKKPVQGLRFVAHQNVMLSLRGYVDLKTPDVDRAAETFSKL